MHNTIRRVEALGPPQLLECALQYAARGWRVFPVHSIVGGRCTCKRENCRNAGKHPWGVKNGVHDATTDQTLIRRWWRHRPHANIGLACGNGLVVVDLDGKENFESFVLRNGKIDETLAVRTGRGVHLYYQGNLQGNPTIDGVLIRGVGGYVVAPPSVHVSGARYAFVDAGAGLAQLPGWVEEGAWGGPGSGPGGSVLIGFGPVPEWLKGHQRKLGGALLEPMTAANRERVEAALASIDPQCSRDIWLRVGMVLHSLEWTDGAGEDVGFELWVLWSEGHWHEMTPNNFVGIEDCETIWRSFKGHGVALGSLFKLAADADSKRVRNDSNQVGGVAAGAQVPFSAAVPAFKPVDISGPKRFESPPFERGQDRRPKRTCENVRLAIEGMGLDCRYDVFHEKLYVSGQLIGQWVGELSDPVVLILRRLIHQTYFFDPGTQPTRDALEQACYEKRYDPVADYLDSLKWDGVPRLDSWTVRYLGAELNLYNCAIGHMMLVAAVRRARVPGCKFDQIIVFEGSQGSGKSTAIEILAGKENFSDQSILGVSDERQQENLVGVWLYEIAELAGMHRAEIEKVKAFASRTHDRARPAYGRYRIDRPRRGIIIATTNAETYLKDDTGARRFWPITTREIALEALRADRDQLWAEAAEIERRAASIAMPRELWAEAAAEQEKRFEHDAWTTAIEKWAADKKEKFMSADVIQGALLLPIGQIDRSTQTRVGSILRKLGYRNERMWDTENKKLVHGYLPKPK